MYHKSENATLEADSPGSQTLASLKAEALKDQGRNPRNQSGRFTTTKANSGVRIKVTRSCKIMKEAYFREMEWSRIFVSGPVDPTWNPFQFYCQLCKANISIYGKGARDFLRHHSTEEHVRKDQRWRYEYLYKVDQVTKSKIHQVRGKDGNLLNVYQLELEHSKYIKAELLEIGQKLPFYDEYKSGMDYMSSSSDNRSRVQLSVLRKFLPIYGNLEFQKTIWSDVGVIVNTKLCLPTSTGGKRLTVSMLSMSYLLPLLLEYPHGSVPRAEVSKPTNSFHLIWYCCNTCSMRSPKTSVLTSTPTVNTQSSSSETGSSYLHSSGTGVEIKSADNFPSPPDQN